LEIGLLNLGPFIGLGLGVTVGGWVGDNLIVLFAKRNNGIYKPEMRLYAQIVPTITTTAGLVAFGLCIDKVYYAFYY
jgi:hypothetical protein